VLQFHGWEKGNPIIQSDSPDEDDSPSVLNCINMECSSSSRDSNSTPPFIEMPDAIYDEDINQVGDNNTTTNTVTHTTTDTVDPVHPVEPVDVKTDYAAAVDDELIATQQRPIQQSNKQRQDDSIIRRKKAIYRRTESAYELDQRQLRMAAAIKNRKINLDQTRQASLDRNDSSDNHVTDENYVDILSQTSLLHSGNRHGTFEGRPSMIIPNVELYPAEFRNIQIPRRTFVFPDYSDPNFRPLISPRCRRPKFKFQCWTSNQLCGQINLIKI
jgi:hypothetical protein